jgi:uncharacterized membrane protein
MTRDDQRRLEFETTLNRWIPAHWLAMLNVANAFIVAGTVLAPWLRATGHTWLAAGVYGYYRLQCLQRPDHSFFLFGQKMGMEHRMVAIYAGWLAAGVAFAMLRDRLRPPRMVPLIVLSMPMLLDIGSQTVGLRDGTWQWRVTTGALFAVATAWWALPKVEVGLRSAVVRVVWEAKS